MKIDNEFLNRVSVWLLYNFNDELVSELYIIGSLLSNNFIHDVDVVGLIKYKTLDDVKSYIIKLKELKMEFLNIFGIELHVTLIYTE